MKKLTVEEKLDEIINYYKSLNEINLVKIFKEKKTLLNDYNFVDDNYFEMRQGKQQNRIVNLIVHKLFLTKERRKLC